jgi:hypothetical protein
MILGCRFLTDVASVNVFQVISAAELYKGDTQNVYIQLLDMAVDRSDQGFSPAGRRYCPPAGTTLTLKFQNIDDAKVVLRPCVQAYPTLDASIWYVPLLSSDPLAGTVTMSATLTEPGSIVKTFVNQKGIMLRVR